MKIATFNTNGIRARIPIITRWLVKEEPDILCLQETKVQDKDFPSRVFNNLGYYCTFRGQKSYNGVAIISRDAPEDVLFGFGGGDIAEESRIITASINGIPVINTYIPQGTAPDSDRFNFKLAWFQRLLRYFLENFTSTEPLIWIGDFNVAPGPLDLYDPEGLSGSIGFHPEEHKALSAVKSWGFVDIFRIHHPHEKAFTFWDYRIPYALKRGLGWRIDHIWATQCLAEKSKNSWIDVDPRKMERPSDHTFLVVEFDF